MNVTHLFASDVLPEWQERANCRDTDTDAFYPEKGQPARPALRICGACDVRTECLQWAIENRERGIWGGTTEPQRRKLARGGQVAA